jgi:hypothetical protein
MPDSTQKPSSAPLETDHGRQKDDNIDDLGHRPDGTEEDQPVDPGKSDSNDKQAGDAR